MNGRGLTRRLRELDPARGDALIARTGGTAYRLARAVCWSLGCVSGLHPIQGRQQMKTQILGAFSAVALLAACSHPAPETPAAVAPPTGGIVPGSQEDLVANVGDRVFFDFNASALRDDARSTLDKQATWLAKYGSTNVQVAGNC